MKDAKWAGETAKLHTLLLGGSDLNQIDLNHYLNHDLKLKKIRFLDVLKSLILI